METNLYNKTAYGLALGLVVFTTLAYGAVHQAVLAIVYTLFAVLVLLWGLDCHKRREIRVSNELLQIPLLAGAVYGLLQIIPFGSAAPVAGVNEIPQTLSLEPFATLLSSAHMLALAVFFAVLLTLLDSEKRVRSLVVFLSVIGFGFAFFSILQSVLSPDKIYGVYGRPGVSVFGSFVNRNHFAAWMEMAIALPLAMLFSGVVSKDKRLLFVTAVTLMGISILLSGSRGGLIAFLVELLFLALITYGSGKRRLGLRIALASALVLAVVGGSIFVGGESSLSRIADSSISSVDQSRSHIWSVSGKMIEYGMPFGVGLGAFGTAYSMFDANSGLERVEQAHNDYLQVLTDAGIPGAFIGLAFLILLFQKGRSALSTENQVKRAISAGALAAVVGVLVHSVFDFVLHTTSVAMLFILMISLLVASNTTIPVEDIKARTRRKGSRSKPRPAASEV